MLRRKEFALDGREVEKLLHREEYGVLATVGSAGHPYGVPLHYVFENGAIYFHCSKEGHLAGNLEYNPDVSFTVVGDTQVLSEEISANYESVIAFGRTYLLREKERCSVLRKLVKKYAADFTEKGEKLISSQHQVTAVYKIVVEYAAGKRRWQSGGSY